MFMILKTDHYQLWYLYKSDFHIFTAEKLAGKFRIKHRNTKISSTLLIMKGFKAALSSLHGGALEIMLTDPLTTNSLGGNYSLILEYPWEGSYNIPERDPRISLGGILEYPWEGF